MLLLHLLALLLATVVIVVVNVSVVCTIAVAVAVIITVMYLLWTHAMTGVIAMYRFVGRHCTLGGALMMEVGAFSLTPWPEKATDCLITALPCFRCFVYCLVLCSCCFQAILA